MSDPHRVDRYGELWDLTRIKLYEEVAYLLKPLVVFSGGWAWHIMSPEGHSELKHAHDHKDLDIMVPPVNVVSTINLLMTLGFERVQTIHDWKKQQDFRRYEKRIRVEGVEHKLTIDFFVADVPAQEIRGWKIVELQTLLSFYSTIHTSKSCFAVVQATNLLLRGIDPIGRLELMESGVSN